MATGAFTSKFFAGKESMKQKNSATPLKRPIWPPVPAALNLRQWEPDVDQPIELSS